MFYHRICSCRVWSPCGRSCVTCTWSGLRNPWCKSNTQKVFRSLAYELEACGSSFSVSLWRICHTLDSWRVCVVNGCVPSRSPCEGRTWDTGHTWLSPWNGRSSCDIEAASPKSPCHIPHRSPCLCSLHSRSEVFCPDAQLWCGPATLPAAESSWHISDKRNLVCLCAAPCDFLEGIWWRMSGHIGRRQKALFWPRRSPSPLAPWTCAGT